MSQWPDGHGELIGLVAEDLRRHGGKGTGREGLPAESALRCGLLKQLRQLSYEELAFLTPPRSAPSRGCRCVDPEEVDAAQDDQGHPGLDLGSDQSHLA
jgi:hypothetical protein